MGLTHFPFGVSSFGMPIIGGGGVMTTGNVFFVDSGKAGASDGHLGDSPDQPLATLNGAMTRCTANNGDIVFLMPGHAENVTLATTQVVSKAGVRMIGLGQGADRPTFTFTATAGSFEMNSASCSIENVVFAAGISAVVVGVNVDGDYVTIRGCEWNFTTTAFDFVMMVDVDDVNHCTIENNWFKAEAATAGAAQAIRLDTADWSRIDNNLITGDYSAAAILGEGAASTQSLIRFNTIYNDDAAAASNGIDINVASTGVLERNSITSLQASDVYSLLDPGSMLCVENYAVNAINERAVVVPELASTSA